MRESGWVGPTGIVLAAGVIAAAAGAPKQDEPRLAVLKTETVWRHRIVCDPSAAGGADKDATGKPSDALRRALPPADWTKPGFDDGAWPRQAGPLLGGYGGGRFRGAVLICLRGRFGATDPAKVRDLKLRLRYRGGAVVYLNGDELARGHVPSGRIQPLTPAEAYPRKVFVRPGGEALLPDYGKRSPPADVRDRYESRIRTLTVAVAPGKLRKGANVLAVALHRAPIPPDLPEFGGRLWDTAGLAELSLTAAPGSAVVPGGGPAGGGVRVWNASTLARVGVDVLGGGAFEDLRPVRLLAPRNGLASGQVVVSAAKGFSGLSAAVSDLKSAAGATLPAACVRVRYAQVGKGYLALLDRPIDGAAIQPVWLTLKVPPDAPAGRYAGRLTVRAGTKTVPVPVEATVYGWRVSDPKDWKTWVNLLQSPESVAAHYKVPLWSGRHFELIGKSMALMGQAGNDVLGLLAVGKSVFGDDPIVMFRRGGTGKLGYVPELKFLRRYLKLYDARAGEPKFLALHVWSYGMYERGFGRDGGKQRKRALVIPAVELAGGGPVPIELPIYGRPGTEELWRQVFDELRGCLKELGWRRTHLLLGTGGDTWPSPQTVAFFRKIAPAVEWRVLTHGCGCPKWGASRDKRTQPNGMVVGYHEAARRVGNHRLKLPDHPVTCNSRDKVGSGRFVFRTLAGVTLAAGYDGYCWKGMDYWTYTTPQGQRRNALNTYVHFGNMVGGTPRAITVPGPDGALATVQYEMLREGTQECEAVLAIRESLETLRPRPVRHYDVIELFLSGALYRADARIRSAAERRGRDLELTLYRDGGRIVVLPHAPTYNTGKHTGSAKDPDGRGLRFDVDVTIGDDRWVKGGPGRYTVKLQRTGDRYQGTYTGTFNGHDRKGAVTGSFRPKGLSVPTGPTPPKTALAERCERAVNDLLACMKAGSRAGTNAGRYEALVARLYEAAAEADRAVRAKRQAARP